MPVSVTLEQGALLVELVGALEVVLGVPALELALLARTRKLLGGVFADRRQHDEALALSSEEVLVDERLQRVEVRPAHLLCSRQRAAAGEDGQVRDDALLAL